MDMRNWPWRKKSSEKILGLNDSVESSPAHSIRHVDDQDVPTDHMGLLSEAGIAQWQQSEEKSQQLKERLSVALLDASAKDELIKQHAKVAEEAVSGWEKAETEAMALKQELESVMQQKLATEDRVSHLDGALKECMRQLRHVREEQEEKIHSATIKTSREWERVRAELEEKLLDMEQKYLERDAENKTVSKLLRERAVTISEMSEARSRAEAHLNVLQIRLESMEKEHSALKLELNVSKKELEKNEEKLSNKRSTEAASRQHLEDCKKIAKLEGECQRLRGLVRKKLPGSGVSVPMKSEMTESSKDKSDSNRKKIGKSAANSREKREDLSNKLQEDTPSGVGKDVDALLDRLSAMEDETRRLKELLVRKDGELQHARLMCARTASKLSSVEEQLENLSHDQGLQKIVGMSALDKHIEAARSLTVSCEPSVASISEDGNDDCSDAWASALIAELAHFKVEKGTSFQEPRLHMPKLQPENTREMDPSMLSVENDEAEKSLEQRISRKAAELHAAQQLCDQLSHKLRVVERELTTLQTQNAATQSSLQTMQGQLDAILQAQDDGKDVDIVLEQVREAMGIPHHMKKEEEKAPSGCIAADIKLKPLGFTPDLTSTVCRLVRIVEDLGFFVPVLPLRKSQQDGKDILQDELECSSHSLFWQCKDLNEKIKAFSAGSNLFLQGGATIVQFLGDLVSILGDLVRARMLKMNVPSCMTIKSCHGDTMSLAIPEAYSPNSVTTKVDVIDKDATKAAPHDEKSIRTVLEMHELTKMEEELRKVQGEKVALETHMRMEFQRLDNLDNEVVQLRGDKVELEHLVEVVKEELDRLKLKLQRAEQAESNLREELMSAASSRQLMEVQLLGLHATQAEAESQLKVIEAERNLLQDRIEVLERGCLEKNAEIAGLKDKCQELTEQLSKYVLEPVFVCSKCSSVNNDRQKESKEQEIAAKLAECQQTILLLGKQLNTFTSSKEHFDQSHDPLRDDQFASQDNDSLLRQYVFSHNPSEFQARQTKSFLEVNSGTSTCKKNRMCGNVMDWEPHRDSSASDTLDSELMSLSKSGRPLFELFGDKTPAHEHYIQAVEQLTSSSDDEECIIPRRVEPPVMTVKSTMKPPLHRKKTSRMYTAVHMSKSMDDTSSEKHNKTFSRLFSRSKNS